METQKKLIHPSELRFGKGGAFAKIMAKTFMHALSIDKANNLYNDTYNAEDYTGELLRRLDVSCIVDKKDLARIPAEGPVIVICNHPTGALDGIMLIDLISRIRPEVKFMGNFLLNRIEPLRKNIIPVDPFDSKSRVLNIKGIKLSCRHLNDGNVLALFPAGEVATWRKGFRNIADRPWDPAVIKFIRRTGVPVIPMYIEGKNSLLFRLAGKIHPMLRTALLPHELFNKKGRKVRVVIGSPIAGSRIDSLDDKTYGDYLRANVEYLHNSRPVKEKSKVDSGRSNFGDIVQRPPLEDLRSEMDTIRDKYLLFEYGDYRLFCAPTTEIPLMMTEIGRVREITFREVGEGSNKSIDIDKYDPYYRQMFIWDNAADCLLGGYRMGFGDEIMPKYGIKGFYTDSLFNYKEEMGAILGQTIELGRSFVTREYQKRPASLMLLWKGILYVLLKHHQFRYLLGPVTISGEFNNISKTVIVTHLQSCHYNRKLGGLVRPVTGTKDILAPIDRSLIEKVPYMELISKLIMDIEQEERTVPVLVKKYMGLNSTVLGFNLDPDFCDALDALMLLDLKHIPDNIIAMLSKEITDIDVIGRFKSLH